MSGTPGLNGLVHTRERVYYALMIVISLSVYGGIAAALYRIPDAAATLAPFALYVVLFALAIFMARGMMLGSLRGNAVHVTARQFPKLHEVAKRHAATLQLGELPEMFVMQSGGILNAFATRFLGRNFVVIFSDVLAMAEGRGENAVGFIVAHELAHLKRGHLRHRWLTMPARLVPYLGAAYSRACEYTCDRMGAHCQPEGAVDGLLVLAAGRELYRTVDAHEYARQVQTQKGFFVNRAELMASHPHLPKRVAALLKVGVPIPAYSPMLPTAQRQAAVV